MNAFTLPAYNLVLKDRVACVCSKADLAAQKLNPTGFSPALKMFLFSTVGKSLSDIHNEA